MTKEMRIIRFKRNKGEKMIECIKEGLYKLDKGVAYLEDAMENGIDERHDDDEDDEEYERQRYLARKGNGMSYRSGRYSRN